MSNTALTAFAVFAMTSHVTLVAYFDARRWQLATAERLNMSTHGGARASPAGAAT